MHYSQQYLFTLLLATNCLEIQKSASGDSRETVRSLDLAYHYAALHKCHVAPGSLFDSYGHVAQMLRHKKSTNLFKNKSANITLTKGKLKNEFESRNYQKKLARGTKNSDFMVALNVFTMVTSSQISLNARSICVYIL